LGASQRIGILAVAISARIITDALVVTAISSARCGRQAPRFDTAHGAHEPDGCAVHSERHDAHDSFAVAAEHIRDFRPGAGHRPQLRSVLAVSASAPREPDAEQVQGLDVAQTLLVAIRKYLAVVARRDDQAAEEWSGRR